MRKDMMSIGITLLILSIIFAGFIFILAFRSEGVCGIYFLVPLSLIVISVIFITQGMTTRESSEGISMRPFPPYFNPPNPQNLAKFCINCNRAFPPDAIICPYCGFRTHNGS